MRKNIHEFIVGVVHAIRELHRVNIAHLDIRLENICYDSQGPILIDLDRWEAADTSFSECYGNTCMYPEPRKYFCEQVDNIQFGYMLLFVLLPQNVRPKDYHSMTPSLVDHIESDLYRNFISQLLQGMCVKHNVIINNYFSFIRKSS